MIKTGDYDRMYLYLVCGTDYQPNQMKKITRVTKPITYVRSFIQWKGFENKYIPSKKQTTAISTQIVKVKDKKCKIVLLGLKQPHSEIDRVDTYYYHNNSKYQGAIFYFDTRKDKSIVETCLKNYIDQINKLQNYVLLQKCVILVSNRAQDCLIKNMQLQQLANRYGLKHYSVCLQQDSDIVQMFEDLSEDRLLKEQIVNQQLFNQTNFKQSKHFYPLTDYYYDKDTFYQRNY